MCHSNSSSQSMETPGQNHPSDGARSTNVQHTEEQLRAVHVGEFTPLSSTIEIVEYDPQWPELYQREETRIRNALGDAALLIEHVGSTSVEGLVAKPRIDILLAVRSPEDESTYVPALETAGYRLNIREPDWYQHRAFRGPEADLNLHVFPPGSPEIDRMLRFRDHLRTHESDRELYARTKRALARKTWKYTQNYADAKSEIVEAILARAQVDSGSSEDPLPILRTVCLALPQVTERLSHGEPAWFIAGKKTFVSYANYHHGERLAFWCAAPPGAQHTLVSAEPEHYFVPAYVGHRGWLGVYLDGPVDWPAVADLVEDAYREVAPKRLLQELDSSEFT
ncbi:MAG: GrpB family protein [Chloroflexota bacterium]